MWRTGSAIAALLVLGFAAAGFMSAQKKTIDLSSAVVVSDSPAASTQSPQRSRKARRPVL